MGEAEDGGLAPVSYTAKVAPGGLAISQCLSFWALCPGYEFITLWATSSCSAVADANGCTLFLRMRFQPQHSEKARPSPTRARSVFAMLLGHQRLLGQRCGAGCWNPTARLCVGRYDEYRRSRRRYGQAACGFDAQGSILYGQISHRSVWTWCPGRRWVAHTARRASCCRTAKVCD